MEEARAQHVDGLELVLVAGVVLGQVEYDELDSTSSLRLVLQVRREIVLLVRVTRT